jgi:hypothetical protein
MFALGSVVSREALADSRGVVTGSTTGAIASLSISVSLKHIRAGGALHKGTIGATAAKIANTSYMLVGIPRGRVCAGSFGGELLLSEAHSGVGASVGADGSLASDALVVGETCALSSGTVAITLIGALNNGVEVIGRFDVSYPSHGLGASALGAISSSPGCIAILAVVASTLVIDPARSMAAAPIGAISNSHSGQSRNEKSAKHLRCGCNSF